MGVVNWTQPFLLLRACFMEVASIFGGALRRLGVEGVGVSGCNRTLARHIELLVFLQCGRISEILRQFSDH